MFLTAIITGEFDYMMMVMMMMMMMMIYDHFVHMLGSVDRATSKGNDAKSKMKQPSDMPTLRFEHGVVVIFCPTLYR